MPNVKCVRVMHLSVLFEKYFVSLCYKVPEFTTQFEIPRYKIGEPQNQYKLLLTTQFI